MQNPNRPAAAVPPSRSRRRRGSARFAGWTARAVLAMAFAPALAAAPAAAAQAAHGQVVARLEVEAPAQASFVLRGTIPVPPGTFPRADGLVPLSILDADGTPVPTQVERVTGYADAAAGADVVEVLGRVSRPAAAGPGARLTYDVAFDPHPRGRPWIAGPVRSLFAPGKLVLTARDVHGNLYAADLWAADGGKRMLKAGSAAVQVRTHGVLVPAQPSSTALPHLMGVHAYLTAWSHENLLSLDLRIHNGSSGLDKHSPLDDPQKKLYFDKIELLTPSGWTLLHELRTPMTGASTQMGTGASHVLLAPLAGDKLHVIGEQAQFHRRMVLAPLGHEARGRALVEERGLGFARPGNAPSGQPLWSWWNPATARYFPQRWRLPSLDHVGAQQLRDQHRSRFQALAGQITSGSAGTLPLLFPTLGWAQPWGTQYGGMTGGDEIHLLDGVETAYAASTAGYRLHQLQHRAYSDRQCSVLFNRDGEPTRLSQWVIHGPVPWVDMLFYIRLLSGPDPFGFSQAPSFQVSQVAAAGRAPPYEGDLLAFAPIDVEHYVRYTSSPKVLAWLGNDSLAKDDLLMAAEVARLSYHAYPYNVSGDAIVSGMLADMKAVHAKPGAGFDFGRGEGWMIDAMVAAYSLGRRDWRNEARPWFDQVTELVERGQAACSGIVMSRLSNKFLNGQYRARQSIEQAIYENAFRGMAAGVYQGADGTQMARIRQVLVGSAYSMVSYPAWDPGRGPWAFLATGPTDGSQPPFCNYLPPGGNSSWVDDFQTWSTFAYAYDWTGDALFLQRALEMAGGGGNLLQAMRAAGTTNLANRAALLSLAETVP